MLGILPFLSTMSILRRSMVITSSEEGGGGGSDTFKTISVSGEDDVVADSATDTLTLSSSGGISIATTVTSDAINFILWRRTFD